MFLMGKLVMLLVLARMFRGHALENGTSYALPGFLRAVFFGGTFRDLAKASRLKGATELFYLGLTTGSMRF